MPAQCHVARNPGGRRRGDSGTRAAILAAARDQFGAKGYQAATIRGIAAQAGVDPALIRHFFGAKEQLFAATLNLPTWFGDHVQGVFEGGLNGIGDRYVRSSQPVGEPGLERARASHGPLGLHQRQRRGNASRIPQRTRAGKTDRRFGVGPTRPTNHAGQRTALSTTVVFRCFAVGLIMR
nr:TetR/AcrR family transcriptional regulator [Nocardia cerradoensis]